jgi:hypothetical protein
MSLNPSTTETTKIATVSQALVFSKIAMTSRGKRKTLQGYFAGNMESKMKIDAV